MIVRRLGCVCLLDVSLSLCMRSVFDVLRLSSQASTECFGLSAEINRAER
jgi:hypothetical protein